MKRVEHLYYGINRRTKSHSAECELLVDCYIWNGKKLSLRDIVKLRATKQQRSFCYVTR